ncbi:MAG: biotin transport system permease protein [Natronomonas sp.]|uniref:energy-coupling factor transporter transmembrane component T family protein n=1 Tax=Natronomonas sp. TaxID=2184060 RepID=UPI003989CD3B
MLTYEPGSSPAHRLDPRSKLAVQLAFAVAAFAYTTPRGLAVLTVFTLGVLAVAKTVPQRVLWEYRFVFPFLLAAPILDGVTWGAPWFVIEDAIAPLLAGWRVLLVLLVAAAYVRTTPVRESRAAVQRLIPGNPGQFLGMGVAFVFRLLPVLLSDIARIRDVHKARLGTERSVSDRMQFLTIAAFNRAFDRADRFALALQARCFSWNPTLPALRLSRLDAVAFVVAAALLGAALISAV